MFVWFPSILRGVLVSDRIFHEMKHNIKIPVLLNLVLLTPLDCSRIQSLSLSLVLQSDPSD